VVEVEVEAVDELVLGLVAVAVDGLELVPVVKVVDWLEPVVDVDEFVVESLGKLVDGTELDNEAENASVLVLGVKVEIIVVDVLVMVPMKGQAEKLFIFPFSFIKR
jgi:hypothetical protein